MTARAVVTRGLAAAWLILAILLAAAPGQAAAL